MSHEQLAVAATEALIPAIERSFYSSAISVTVFSALLWNNSGSGLLIWLLLRLAVSVLSVVSIRRVGRSTGSTSEAQRALVLVMGVSGITWGLLPAFVDATTPEWQAVVVLWIFGNQSVITAVCAPSRHVFTAAMGTVTVAGAVTMALQAGSFSVTLGFLILLGGVYSLSIFDSMHRATTAALTGELAASIFADKLERRQEYLSEANQVLMGMAFEDPLTGLPNRRGFMSETTNERRFAKKSGWIGFIDLDHFKEINDGLGHRAGDEVLTEVGRRWRRILREDAVIARTGGDEFVFALGEMSAADADAMGRRLLAALDEPIPLTGATPVQVSCSIGLAQMRAGLPVSNALSEADSALYAVKSHGRAGVALHPVVDSIDPVGPLPEPKYPKKARAAAPKVGHRAA